MAQFGRAQERLDKLVHLIAANMAAEACSIYTLRTDGMLELCAAKGHDHQAAHRTVTRVGKSLVALVASEAAPINLPDVRINPAFSDRPEFLEEMYMAFLGVPSLRRRDIIGVLVVQNRERRVYSEVDFEALQTAAIVLSEMMADCYEGGDEP